MRESAPRKPLRLWPGVVAVAVQWLAWFGTALVYPEATPWGVVVALWAGLFFIVWWLLLSRAPWPERVGALAAMVAGMAVAKQLVHPSIAGGGMGMLLFLYSVPILSLALVAAAAVCQRMPTGTRRATMLGAILLACASFTLVRTGGVTGLGDSDLHWRWTPSPEERLLATASEPTSAVPASAPARVDWPGFRGARRDGVVSGIRIATDWSTSPPVELWRRPIGPGWSSFAVGEDLVYTQEQRGEHELVSCYRRTTGQPVWSHADAVRFWESNAGAGPRATPTLHGERVYSMGATGIVDALDAGSGALVWTRDAAADAGVAVPEWGFASSPLVVEALVVVAAGGRLVAYDAESGALRWLGPSGGMSYSSPHQATIAGAEQVLLLSGGGATSVALDGALLWQHAWEEGASMVQPALTADGDVLLTACYEMGGIGLARIAVARGAGGWTTEARWTSRALKPYFNDFVVHEGHAYGFDNAILACVDLADGARRWKGGRYGHGQLVLLADADLLLVLSEEGELALVSATFDDFRELARRPAIAGKTWNHPVLVGDVLLVRNGEEMAAFRLPAAGE